jgi:hypothetical protein
VGEGVIEFAFDNGTREEAQAGVVSVDSGMSSSGAVKYRITSPMDFEGFKQNISIRGVPYLVLKVALARGPYVFVIAVRVLMKSPASDSQLVGNLAAAQWRKVSGNTPDTTLSYPDDIWEAIGVFIAILISYLGIVNFIAYAKSPAQPRRRGKDSEQPLLRSESFDVTDVSDDAEYDKFVAFLRFALQSIAAAVAVVSVDALPLFIGYWYLYLIAGVAAFWAAGRFVHPKGWRRTNSLAILTGSHRVQAISLMVISSAIVILGLQMVLTYSVKAPEPIDNAQDGALVYWGLTGVALVAIGAIIHRYGRRRGAIEAHRLMLRDARQPILFLRSFGDDRLKLWTAALGRPSFIERFSPSRFDTFEEVLVRHLSLRGPVIALNPPFTTLPPLGAARATLDPADWQSTIGNWMEQAAQIVFVAPPDRVTQGFLWELRTVSTSKYWDKTLLVAPPCLAAHSQ